MLKVEFLNHNMFLYVFTLPHGMYYKTLLFYEGAQGYFYEGLGLSRHSIFLEIRLNPCGRFNFQSLSKCE